MDDEKLIIQVKNRDEKALRTIMDLYLTAIYRVAYGILADVCPKEDIEECVQDVFVDCWNKIEKYDENRGTFKSWLLILCKYKALNLRKKLNKNNNIVDIETVHLSTKQNIDEEVIGKESKMEILKIINGFKDMDREIFLRRYFLNQDIDSICAAMKFSRQAVDNRLWRGRKKIKETLEIIERRHIND